MTEKKDYTKEIVLIEDELLKEHGILGIGIKRREKEIHLEFFIENKGLLFHRDIEVKPNGLFDTSSMLPQEDIAKRLKDLKG